MELVDHSEDFLDGYVAGTVLGPIHPISKIPYNPLNFIQLSSR